MFRQPARRLFAILCLLIGLTPALYLTAADEPAPTPTAAAAPAAAVAPVAAWNTLPDTSWLVISLPDVKHARQAFESGKLRALGKLDGFKDFVGDVEKFYLDQLAGALQNGNAQTFLKVLHHDLDSLLQSPDGELTFALIEVIPAEQRFDLLLRLDVAKDEQVASFNDLIDMILAMRPELPLKKSDQKFGDKKAYALEIPEMNLAAFYATCDKCLSISTRDDRFAALVQRQSLAVEKETPLKDSALVKSIEKTLKGRPDFFFLVNPEAIPEKQVEDPGQLKLFQGLKRLGVRRFAYALRLDETTGNVLEALVFDYNPAVWKADAPLTQPVDLSSFERGPGGTFAQAGINVNWAQAWAVINNFIKTGPNADEGTRTIDGLEKFLGMKVPEFLAAF
ncbi:MAG TPA: hypothetical protein VL860_05035, partial [Planctomycetota bacterium]|nr:hypothetical protein [Planctomycetota bacterium]